MVLQGGVPPRLQPCLANTLSTPTYFINATDVSAMLTRPGEK